MRTDSLAPGLAPLRLLQMVGAERDGRGLEGVEVVELREMDELKALQELLLEVWTGSREAPLSAELLRALVYARNYVAGARMGHRLVGGVAGIGGWDREGAVILHSHVLGVAAGARLQGIGHALKQHQRRWAAERGIGVIEWTFDPLVRRNAYFNLVKLGAEAAEYHVRFYGPMDDVFNHGDESDRVVVRWRVDATAESPPRLPENVPMALHVGEGGRPVRGDAEGPVVLCQVPPDIVEVRRTAPELARSWRLALRATLGEAMRAGRRVAGITHDGWYVLKEAE